MNEKFQHKSVNIFLRIIFIVCFGCSKEPSHRDGSFEYPQHMFWLRNKIFFCYSLLIKALSVSVKFCRIMPGLMFNFFLWEYAIFATVGASVPHGLISGHSKKEYVSDSGYLYWDHFPLLYIHFPPNYEAWSKIISMRRSRGGGGGGGRGSWQKTNMSGLDPLWPDFLGPGMISHKFW